ncbi:hypothetical protein MKY34_14190 [Sporosarcina sp. FSL K6-1522]|uniref:hypothetical protein n=1 Tax=Sporosarcina sp. FSL K6-1522 TaxID=2921554 RepID=UPI00315A2E1F
MRNSLVLSRLLWTAGLFGLLLIGVKLEIMIKQSFEISFTVLPLFWFQAIAPLLLGVYTSLLFVTIKSFRLQLPLLLCVTLPCLLISFYMPIAFMIVSAMSSSPENFSVPIPFWMLTINSFGIVPVVAGLTLVMSLFGTPGNQSNNFDVQETPPSIQDDLEKQFS